jgi:hypothetical protein
MKLVDLRTPFTEMTYDDKLSLLEEIRSRRVPVIKPKKTKANKEVKPRKQRKPRSIEEALAYMNEQIRNMENIARE